MKKPKKLSEEQILQISNDLSEDDLSKRVTVQDLTQVVAYWREAAEKEREARFRLRCNVMFQVTEDMLPDE